MFKGMAALAALLVALPAAAQMQVTPYNGTANSYVTGALTTAGDTVPTTVAGSQWATVQWAVVGTAGTATVAAEVSNDGGTNYFAAPLSRRTSLVNVNPTVQRFIGSTLSTGNTWETPLPANATNFRLRCIGSGTTTTVQMAGGTPYVPNMPVAAVLYDVSTTAGAANNTGTLDATGWRQVLVSIVQTSAATGAATLDVVDDTGTAISIGTSASIAVGTFSFGWGDGVAFGTANPFTMVGGVTSLPLDRRFDIAVAGATTSATRIRIVARR